ncbi:MAG: M28 family peptidase [Anaerolineales bacterium]
MKRLDRSNEGFNGDRAYEDVILQLSFGPRNPGTEGHDLIQEWIEKQLIKNNWQVTSQELKVKDKTIINLIASRGSETSYILLGAHYDTRIYADQDSDPAKRKLPVPGANDGGSGVAVLLELARILPVDLGLPVQLVFFDAEDNGNIEDWDWVLGSRAFVEMIKNPPEAAIIVDMVGDADLNLYQERNSDQIFVEQIWTQAKKLGYDKVFIPEYKHSMLDDHIPFIEAGIPAVDIIDFDYPYWHTTMDTADKVSPDSLEIVGDTLLAWILSLE